MFFLAYFKCNYSFFISKIFLITDTGCDCFNSRCKRNVRKFVKCMLQYNIGTIPLSTRKEKHYSLTLYHMHSQCNKHVQTGGAGNWGRLQPVMGCNVRYIPASSVSKCREKSSCRRFSRHNSYSDLVIISELYDLLTLWNHEFSKCYHKQFKKFMSVNTCQ
jgi:hypothetical protein